jgi:hypothetical protein
MFGPGAKAELNAHVSKIVTSGTFFGVQFLPKRYTRFIVREMGALQNVPSLTILGR